MNKLIQVSTQMIETSTVAFSFVMTTITALLGGWDKPLQVLIIFICMDILTGILKGWYFRDWRSKRLREGLITKVGYLVIVAVVTQLDILLEEPVLRTMVIWFYIGVEGLSIVENMAEMGIPVPKSIVDRLAVMKNGIEREDDNKKSE